MTNCWPEGSLRAYLDRELPPAEMRAVAAHLHECSECDSLCAELSARAARVFDLLAALPEPEKVVPLRPTPKPRPSHWLWPGAAVALAAGLALAFLLLPRREAPAPPAPVLASVPPVETHPVEPAVIEPVRPVSVVAPRAQSAVARIRPRPIESAQSMDYFVALDDRPIENGVIMRMAIQPGNAQADIVFDPAGRPRAIRLVNEKQQ